MDYKQILIIRRDLHMRRGKEIAQTCHSSLAAILNDKFLLKDSDFDTVLPDDSRVHNYISTSSEKEATYLCIPLTPVLKAWLLGSFKKITVYVNSEAELLEIHEKAKQAGIITSLIQDSGLTEFHNIPTYTAVAVGPDTSEKIDPITKHLPLL